MRYITDIYSALLKYISNLNISLKLSLYQSSQRKSIKYHCRWNLNQLRSSWKLLNGIHNRYLLRLVQIHFKFEHFFEIISIWVISKKIYQISLYVQLKPLRSNWKLLNAMHNRNLLRLVKYISNLNISLKLSIYQSSQRKSIKYHCRWNLNQLRSSWKLLNGIHNRYLLRLVQIHFKFEHFFEIISISVISKKIYQISLYVQLKPLRSSLNYSMR